MKKITPTIHKCHIYLNKLNKSFFTQNYADYLVKVVGGDSNNGRSSLLMRSTYAITPKWWRWQRLFNGRLRFGWFTCEMKSLYGIRRVLLWCIFYKRHINSARHTPSPTHAHTGAQYKHEIQNKFWCAQTETTNVLSIDTHTHNTHICKIYIVNKVKDQNLHLCVQRIFRR